MNPQDVLKTELFRFIDAVSAVTPDLSTRPLTGIELYAVYQINCAHSIPNCPDWEDLTEEEQDTWRMFASMMP